MSLQRSIVVIDAKKTSDRAQNREKTQVRSNKHANTSL